MLGSFVCFGVCLCVGIKRLPMFVYNGFMFAQMTKSPNAQFGSGPWDLGTRNSGLLPSQAFPLALLNLCMKRWQGMEEQAVCVSDLLLCRHCAQFMTRGRRDKRHSRSHPPQGKHSSSHNSQPLPKVAP